MIDKYSYSYVNMVGWIRKLFNRWVKKHKRYYFVKIKKTNKYFSVRILDVESSLKNNQINHDVDENENARSHIHCVCDLNVFVENDFSILVGSIRQTDEKFD